GGGEMISGGWVCGAGLAAGGGGGCSAGGGGGGILGLIVPFWAAAGRTVSTRAPTQTRARVPPTRRIPSLTILSCGPAEKVASGPSRRVGAEEPSFMVHCTNPTLGAGVGSGASRMVPNWVS